MRQALYTPHTGRSVGATRYDNLSFSKSGKDENIGFRIANVFKAHLALDAYQMTSAAQRRNLSTLHNDINKTVHGTCPMLNLSGVLQ